MKAQALMPINTAIQQNSEDTVEAFFNNSELLFSYKNKKKC